MISLISSHYHGHFFLSAIFCGLIAFSDGGSDNKKKPFGSSSSSKRPREEQYEERAAAAYDARNFTRDEDLLTIPR